MMASEKINLLVLIRDYPVGLAVTKKIHNLLTFLINKNMVIRVLSYRSKFSQPAYDSEKYLIPFESIGNNVKLTNPFKTSLYYLRGLRTIGTGKKNGYENIFYCVGPVNIENFLFVFWARIRHYKIVFDINEDYSFFEDNVKTISRIKIATTRKLDILTYKWAQAITVVSSHLRNKYLNLTDKPVILVPVTAAPNLKPERKSGRKGIKVVYAGTFDLKDGVKSIIEGFLLFGKKHENAELILAGKSEQQLDYKKEYQNCQNIIFKGYVPDSQFYEILREADVLCMCRTNSDFSNAGFPFKLGEYLATGNPVISTRASDVCTYLSQEDAFIVDFDSPSGIAAALESITENPDEARRIGLNGFKKYETFFSPESNGKLLHDLLKSI